MQIRAYIVHFIAISVILIMAACSVSSRSTHAKEEIIEEMTPPDQWNSEAQDTTDHFSSKKDRPLSPEKIIGQETQDTIPSPLITKKDTLQAGDSTVTETIVISPGFSGADTLAQDTLVQDSVQQPKPLFNDIVNYSADDSIKFSIDGKKMFLYKNAFVKYLSTELKADFIELNMENNEAYASGVPDSAGVMIGKPKFKDGSQEFESLDLKYNFKTGKGFVKEIITQQGEGYIQGKLTKRMSDSIYCVKDGWYTTCDQHDHPHFYIRMSKAKLIKDKKVVSGFANLYIEDVPLPLAIPFGFFPISKKGTSG